MNEQARDSFEERSHALFHDSVDGLDFALRSRLTQARSAALDAAAASSRKPWFFRKLLWTPAAGVTAAAVLGVALWFGPMGHHNVTAADGPNLEDLEIVASSEEGSGDAIDMLQDDIAFYDWANSSANSGPAA